MAASSRFSSNRSKFVWKLDVFSCSFGLIVRVVWIVTLIGMTTSIPYTRQKGVSLVGVCTVVWYVHKTCYSSSTQFPLVFPSLFLILLTRVRFFTSTWPLACGWATEVKCCWIPFSWHHFLKGFSANYFPLSLMMVWGSPKWQTIYLHMNLTILIPIMTVTGSTSTHLVK